MRAICGAVITAAALLGLGLTAQGIGARYNGFRIDKVVQEGDAKEAGVSLRTEPNFDKSHVRIRDLDGPFQLCLVVLVLAALIGLGITFVGLMYHHHKRYHEHLRLHGPGAPTMTTHTAPSHVTS